MAEFESVSTRLPSFLSSVSSAVAEFTFVVVKAGDTVVVVEEVIGALVSAIDVCVLLVGNVDVVKDVVVTFVVDVVVNFDADVVVDFIVDPVVEYDVVDLVEVAVFVGLTVAASMLSGELDEVSSLFRGS